MSPVGLGAIRLVDPEDPDVEQFEPKDIDLPDDNQPDPKNSTKIELDDGSVIVRIGPPRKEKKDTKFDDNLAMAMDEAELTGIADRLLRLIESDDTSRKEWLDTRAEGMKIMGLKIEPMRTNGADGSAPLEGMSNVRAIELAEAVIRFSANAFSELCPVDGPVKVAEIGLSDTNLDDDAQALEIALNDYLLEVDKPYIPDTDAMLPRVGLDGSVAKKIYHDPILRRPISRAVYGDDLIVDNSAKSLFDAKRITHRVFMNKSTIQRMEFVEAWREIKRSSSAPVTDKTPVELEKEEISGVTARDSFEEDDSPFEFYESYCELDLPDFRELDGMEVPYKVVIDKEAKTVVEIRRNWKEDDDMCLPKTWFVLFPFMRGFGVYGIGLSHMLGNITNGLTALMREFIDAGMFANFPGFMVDKGTNRQNTNINRVPPGGSWGLETGGRDIRAVVAPLPYKSPDAVFAAFIQQLQQTAQRMGGTADIMVGEGRQDAPVGTTLALIEQAIKPLMATHKRLCQAQGDELQLLVERFREDPTALLKCLERAGYNWPEERLLAVLNDRRIVPRADPNTASHIQRMLRNAALYQMAKDDPTAFNTYNIRQDCIRGIGYGNPERYLLPPNSQQGPPPDPKALAAQTGAQADLIDAQTKAAELEFKKTNLSTEDQNRDQDRQSKMAIAGMQLKREQLIQQGESVRAQQGDHTDVMRDALDKQQESQENQRDRMHEALMKHHEQQHAIQTTGMEQAHDMRQSAMDQAHDIHTAGLEHAHDIQTTGMEQAHDTQAAGMNHENALRLAKMKPKPAKPSGKKK